MGLTLTGRDVAAFVALQETLLAPPFDHAIVDDWCFAVLKQTETLFQADRSAMMVPVGRQVH